jgi:hypothetical protein
VDHRLAAGRLAYLLVEGALRVGTLEDVGVGDETDRALGVAEELPGERARL